MEIIQTILLVAVIISLWIVRNSASGYFDKKSRNLADKEDIEEITAAIEQAKADHSAKLEDLLQKNRLIIEQEKAKHQWQFVALAER